MFYGNISTVTFASYSLQKRLSICQYFPLYGKNIVVQMQSRRGKGPKVLLFDCKYRSMQILFIRHMLIKAAICNVFWRIPLGDLKTTVAEPQKMIKITWLIGYVSHRIFEIHTFMTERFICKPLDSKSWAVFSCHFHVIFIDFIIKYRFGYS